MGGIKTNFVVIMFIFFHSGELKVSYWGKVMGIET